jgi:hypothetical protein
MTSLSSAMNSVFTSSSLPTPMLPMMQTWQAYPPNMYSDAPVEHVNNGNVGPANLNNAIETAVATSSITLVTDDVPTALATGAKDASPAYATAIQQAVDRDTIEPGATLLA